MINGIGIGIGFESNLAGAQVAPVFDVVSSNQLFGFSYRKLRTDYTGPCIRIRRSLDNTEKDIGFSGDYLDVIDIFNFCGGGAGYMVRFYDQSIIANNLQQTNLLQQPLVYSGQMINIINQNGYYNNAPYFDGSQFLTFVTPQVRNVWSFYPVINIQFGSYDAGFGGIVSDNGGNGFIFHNFDGYFWFGSAGYQKIIDKAPNFLSALTALSNGTTVDGWKDGVFGYSINNNASFNISAVNGFWAGGLLASWMPEIIGYSDKKVGAENAEIMINQKTYYKI
jgi:hypothetical protein